MFLRLVSDTLATGSPSRSLSCWEHRHTPLCCASWEPSFSVSLLDPSECVLEKAGLFLKGILENCNLSWVLTIKFSRVSNVYHGPVSKLQYKLNNEIISILRWLDWFFIITLYKHCKDRRLLVISKRKSNFLASETDS